MDKKKLIVLAKELADRTSKSSVALTERILRSALKSSDDDEIQKKNFFYYLIIAVDNIEAISGETNKKSKEEFENLVKNVFIIEKRNTDNIEIMASKFQDLKLEEWCYIIGWTKKLNTNKLPNTEKEGKLIDTSNYLSKVKSNNLSQKPKIQKEKTNEGFNTPFADMKLNELLNNLVNKN